jgi:hypothetical protein
MILVSNAEDMQVCAWVRSRRGKLEIYHRGTEPYWVEFAIAYWEQRLDGLYAVTSSRYTTVHRGRPTTLGMPCYFKRFLMRNSCDWAKHLVRASRAMRAARQGALLQALGFTTPRTFCVIQERRAGVVVQSAIVMEACDDAVALKDWLTQPARQHNRFVTNRRALIDALAREVGRMHCLGIRHGDMHGGNILCRWRDGRVAFIWLDNEHTRRYAVLPLRERLHNLRRLSKLRRYVSLTDRLRFWKAYCVASRIAPHECKQLAQQLLAILTKRQSGKRK